MYLLKTEEEGGWAVNLAKRGRATFICNLLGSWVGLWEKGLCGVSPKKKKILFFYFLD